MWNISDFAEESAQKAKHAGPERKGVKIKSLLDPL